MTKQVRYLASLIVGSSFFFIYFCFFTPHVCEIMHAMAGAFFFIPNTAISCFFVSVDKLEIWCFVFLYI